MLGGTISGAKVFGSDSRENENSLASAVVKTKDGDAVTVKYEGLRSGVEQRVTFANKEMARLDAVVSNVTQEQDASVAKADKLSHEVQCVIGLGEDTITF